ncbi:pirin family protein [Marinobacterium sedimentorum]|uniref:pirin family protein n=1 Tax=Marinobacterium sedimentorum TaxID=2927804 RepID=UPI0020C71428|nr:pirin family protein [Marinobacterium sedimentorum]MCP8687278.1 pirin family protein [Marinobacterium sedimentorum]
MITVRSSEARGRGNHGWLDSRHSFSFADYYDPKHMGFSALRVINEDKVTPGSGFGTHGHKDMEIISYVLDGVIAHKDSEGNVQQLPAGEFQLMSAGSGIRHSEYNASESNGLRFLQIWIQPDQFGGKPGYQQKNFGRRNGLTLVISPDGEAGSLTLRQDARLYQLLLDSEQTLTQALRPGRRQYVHLIKGSLTIGNTPLKAGDGASIEGLAQLSLQAGKAPVEALLFDLP